MHSLCSLWTYNPINNDTWGDSWNGENFSWFSLSDRTPEALAAVRDEPEWKQLNVGTRVLDAIEVSPLRSLTDSVPIADMIADSVRTRARPPASPCAATTTFIPAASPSTTSIPSLRITSSPSQPRRASRARQSRISRPSSECRAMPGRPRSTCLVEDTKLQYETAHCACSCGMPATSGGTTRRCVAFCVSGSCSC